MWPGEQSPAGGPEQPNPYKEPPAPWNAPTVASGPPVGGPPGRGPGGGRTKLVAIGAAAAVVVAAAVTGAVLLGGDEDDSAAGPDPAASSASASASAAADDPRSGDSGPAPTVAGWTVVANPDHGIAFDVPASWAPKSRDWVTYVAEDDDPDEKPLVAMKAPAVLQEEWCASDGDRDGSVDHTPLASAGTRGNNGARSTEDVARTDSAAWVYGAYTQPDRDKISTGPVTSFTTASGIRGSVATSRSSGVAKKDKCDVEGKATTFAFETADGDFASWSFFGAAGVDDEVPETTVREILATVREYTPSDS
ncbi:hypothetical protein ACFY1G_25535 [Streptomyces olivaceus]|uniref:DUF8017 domain-containing protein n=1 Tax=Streptomyces olivaceus TaxID=47716 RepID=A0ABS7WD00_STROV|nr:MULTISPECIES: hypothetical protein [Streptomyces]AOW85887.1 hypothetical protein BC342_04390 [Streptomyces olivaceus]MBZ6092206.1 hypothetical protein [Streptomyces olivaceus]MBZ6099284.1 hypothetical protein [Streptomyces olivaceus]MBZ6120192.1 hypothetical protein [Streptomyces olivaceus]MBZ6155170.1 hypothetical protein [Streptomyces olivaceus]